MRCPIDQLPIALDQAEHIMASCFTLAAASKSKRRATAAMLVHFEDGFPTIISSGVNGTAPGASNVMENADLTLSLSSVIHAEVNCINRMEEQGMWVRDGNILFCTDSPCPNCLDAMEVEGIETVVYAREYRLTDHLDASDIKMFCLDMDNVAASMQLGLDRMREVIATTPVSE